MLLSHLLCGVGGHAQLAAARHEAHRQAKWQRRHRFLPDVRLRATQPCHLTSDTALFRNCVLFAGPGDCEVTREQSARMMRPRAKQKHIPSNTMQP